MGESMVITGGGRGIGRATALLAAQRGYDVCISYQRDRHAAEQVVAACQSAGATAFAVRCEVTDEDDVQALFDTAGNKLGWIDVVVINAGVTGSAMPFVDYTVERMRHVFDVNVLGAFICAREAVRAMLQANGGRGGSIVNVSSAASRLGSPNEYIDYAASKGAMDSMTLGLAKELAGDGIRVNAVRPGLIETDFHRLSGDAHRVSRLAPGVPMGRGGTAEEVASAILWLASAEASYITGSLLDCSGGR